MSQGGWDDHKNQVLYTNLRVAANSHNSRKHKGGSFSAMTEEHMTATQRTKRTVLNVHREKCCSFCRVGAPPNSPPGTISTTPRPHTSDACRPRRRGHVMEYLRPWEQPLQQKWTRKCAGSAVMRALPGSRFPRPTLAGKRTGSRLTWARKKWTAPGPVLEVCIQLDPTHRRTQGPGARGVWCMK